MANKKPAFILKDATSSIAGQHQIGQNSEIVLPQPVFKKESMRNGGMIKPRKVMVGVEELTTEISLIGVDPHIFSLYGFAPGQDIPIFHYGYMQSENGRNHSAKCEMQCSLETVAMNNWQTGQSAGITPKLDVNSYTLWIDGEEILRVDDFNMFVGGKEIMPGRAEALRLN